MYCSQCGSQFEGNFCPDCGEPSGSAAPVVHEVRIAYPTNPTSTCGWMGWIILCICMPFIGAVVMALVASDQSAKNFAKAILAFWAIGLFFVISLAVLD